MVEWGGNGYVLNIMKIPTRKRPEARLFVIRNTYETTYKAKSWTAKVRYEWEANHNQWGEWKERWGECGPRQMATPKCCLQPPLKKGNFLAPKTEGREEDLWLVMKMQI